MKILINAYWKRWIRKYGCKLSGGPVSLPKESLITLEPAVSIADVEMQARKLSVGHSTYIRSGGVLAQVDVIGRYCSIGKNVVVGLSRDLHPIHWVTTHPVAEVSGKVKHHPAQTRVSIGHDVWVGRDVVIMSGVTIGTGAVVAAGSVVVKDVPPYAVVGGNPAKVLKLRFGGELIAKLLASRWWDIDYDTLISLPMNNPEEFLDSLVGLGVPVAKYGKLEVARAGCRYLDE